MEKLSSNRLNDDTIKLLKRVAYSLFQSIFILFLGLILIFLVSSWIFDDIQFGSYLGNFFIGNWGTSDYGWSRGYEVLEWMSWMFPRTIELIIGPIIIGSLLGVILGRISASNLNKWQDKTVKLLSVLGISIPVFFLGTSLQVIFGFHLKNLTNGAIYLPMSGLSSMSISSPPFLTGFRTLDCLFAGEWGLLWDTIWHLILPGIVFTIFVMSIVIIYTRFRLSNNIKTISTTDITQTSSYFFGFMFSSSLIVENIFNMNSLGFTLNFSLIYGDYFMLNGIMFTFLIFFVVISFCLNIIYAIYKHVPVIREFVETKIISKFNLNIEVENTPEPVRKTDRKSVKSNLQEPNKRVLLAFIKSPFFIIGVVLIIPILFFTIFAPSLTSFTYRELTTSAGWDVPWQNPSAEHPLGTIIYGYDLAGLIVYGIRNLINAGFLITMIGLGGGLIIGSIAGIMRIWGGKWGEIVEKILMCFVKLSFFIPWLVIVVIMPNNFGMPNYFGSNESTIINTIGILFIPVFTQIIRNSIIKEKENLTTRSPNDLKIGIKNLATKIIPKIPQFMGFAFIAYTSVAYIGLGGYVINLGNVAEWGKSKLITMPLASFLPMTCIFLSAFAFISLGIGLNSFLMQIKKTRNITNEINLPETSSV